MINSTINKYKRLKVDTEGEPQQQSSEYQCIKKELNISHSNINEQVINIHCNSAKFTTDVALLESVKILFPVPNDVFKGRDSIFDELNEYLTKTQIAVICGMAGIGKTESAKQFAWKNFDKYGMKLWINTDSEENTQKSVKEIAWKLSIDTDNREISNIINDIYDYFENRNIFTLFVFDNANDRRSIDHLLPSKVFHDNSFTHIIVTSQNKKWGKRNGKDIPTIELEPLDLKSSVDVFREIIDDNFDNYELALWENLAELENNIPLALQITASYIKNEIESIGEFGLDGETFSLRDYIQKLEDELHLIIDEPFPDDCENAYPRTLYIAISMTLKKINLQSAFDMLYAISYLDPNCIEEGLLLKLMSKEAVRKSLEILAKYSLINTNNFKKNRKIGMHRLVQWILRYHQEKAGREVQTFHYNKVFTTLMDANYFTQGHYTFLFKHEGTFKEIIKDYFMCASKFPKIRILIKFEAVNSLLLIIETLNNPKQVIDWTSIALDCNSTKSFNVFYQYLSKVNNELKCFPTFNNGIILFFLMHVYEFIEKNLVDTFDMLLKKCTDVNVSDAKGYGITPIMLAAYRNQSECVRLLLETRKVDLNQVDKLGWTVYHYLIEGCRLYNFNIELRPEHLGSDILKYGFNIHVIDECGRSLLHHACKCVSFSYVKFLIEEHHLDVHLKDKYGTLPIFSCFEYTPQFMGSETMFHLSKNEDHIIGCIDALAKNGADLKALQNDGKTILHHAAKFYPLVVKYLVTTHGMDVNVQDENGVTPMDIILKRNSCYDDVELAKRASFIIHITGDEKNLFLEPMHLKWILNINKENFPDFSCTYKIKENMQ